MKKFVFSIYDVKAEVYAPPFLAHNQGEAMRMFMDVGMDSRTSVSQHPEDYALYHLGSFDADTGVIVGLVTPLHVCNAVDLIKRSECVDRDFKDGDHE